MRNDQPLAAVSWQTAALLVSGVAFALLGQYMYTYHQQIGGAALGYGIALVQWIAALARLPRSWSGWPQARIVDAAPQAPAQAERSWLRWTLLLVGLVCGVFAYLFAWDEHIDILLLVNWIVGLGCWWLALSPRADLTRPAAQRRLDLARRALARLIREDGAALALILVVGAVALFWGLNNTPYEMISDHAENVLDVNNILHGEWRIYMTNNSGREPGFFYLAALAGLFFGPSFLALKVASAIGALLTLPTLYYLGKSMHGPRLGLCAALLAAVSVWQLINGRMGFRASYAELAAALLMLALWQALRSLRRNDFLLVGLVLGLGQYGYSSFRLAPLLLVGAVFLRWLELRGPDRRRLLAHTGAALLIALMAFVPLLSFWAHYPELYWFRANAQVGAVSGLGGAVGGVLDGLLQTLLMFNFTSDPVPLNVIPRDVLPGSQVGPVSPTLGLVTGALFLLGLLLWLWMAARRRRPLLWFVPLAFAVFLLPSALGISRPGELPSARRAIAALPALMLLAGSALVALLAALRDASGRRGLVPRRVAQGIGLAVVGGLLIVSAAVNLGEYFGQYGPFYYEHTRPQREVGAEFLRFKAEGGSWQNAYLVYGTGHGWLDPRAVGAWVGDPRWDRVVVAFTPETCPYRALDSGPLIAVLGLADETDLALLQTCYPEHTIRRVELGNRGGYAVFEAP